MLVPRVPVALAAFAMAAAALAPSSAIAERLPVKTYTIADGLAHDSITCVFQDSRGFMWFCTSGGLSRFDGAAFANYDTNRGMSNNYVSAMIEDRSGVYWIAGIDSLSLFDARAAAPKFVTYRRDPERLSGIQALVKDRRGSIWCGTASGLFKLTPNRGGWNFEPIAVVGGATIAAIVEAPDGALWVGSANGLYRLRTDGRTELYTTQLGVARDSVTALLADREGRLWIATQHGLGRLVANPDPTRPLVERLYTARDGLPADTVSSLFESRDGTVWAAFPQHGLVRFDPSRPLDRDRIAIYTTANGLSDKTVTALAEDRDNNLWVGTEGGGIMKITHHGFTTFGEADGISQTRINGIFEDRAGDLCVVGTTTGRIFIDRLNGRRFDEVALEYPVGVTWGWYQFVLQDHAGEWWVPTATGIYRYPAAARPDALTRLRPTAVYTTRDGLTANEVFRLFEDAHGDIWIGTITPGSDTLTRFDRAAGTFHRYSPADGIPASAPTAFANDAAGNLWIGFYVGGLVRYRGGRFTRVPVSASGTDAGFVRALYRDHRGRLWAAVSPGGAIRIDDPAAEHPHLVVYGPNEGLSSAGASSIVEDQWGRIYLGTGRGVDRLDPATGQIRHYTTADGLAQNYANVSFRDRRGALWFGTLRGLSRLDPEPTEDRRSPPILIGGIRVRGLPVPVADLGETDVTTLELKPDQNDVQIDFFSLGFRSGESVRYQHALEGADRGWSPPTPERTLSYASLGPGSYRFMVRAINTDGLVSAAPATFSFVIERPLWERWWFLTLASVAAALTIYAAYRYRFARLLELERIRTRIAADLHDDIGANLSRVAILSEVLQQHSGGDGTARRLLTEIADSARQSVDAMSDIVWAVDPRRDSLNDVILRVRQFASDVFDARGITWDFQVPPDGDKVKLDAGHRRHLLLIFQEAINNVVRHSGATSCLLRISVAARSLQAEIRDNGRGFVDLEADAETNGRGGHGLGNMRARAQQLRGRCEVATPPGGGTLISIEFPLR